LYFIQFLFVAPDFEHLATTINAKIMYDKEKPLKKQVKEKRRDVIEESELRKKKRGDKKVQKYPHKWDHLLDEEME
jgi:hypothetical protein